jgi:hypothetical protein
MSLGAVVSAICHIGQPALGIKPTLRPPPEPKPLTKYDLVALERARLKRERKLKR